MVYLVCESRRYKIFVFFVLTAEYRSAGLSRGHCISNHLLFPKFSINNRTIKPIITRRKQKTKTNCVPLVPISTRMIFHARKCVAVNDSNWPNYLYNKTHVESCRLQTNLNGKRRRIVLVIYRLTVIAYTRI